MFDYLIDTTEIADHKSNNLFHQKTKNKQTNCLKYPQHYNIRRGMMLYSKKY